MKRIILLSALLMLEIIVSVPAMAGINVSIGISLPPAVVFAAPPEVIVMPDTDDAYVVPDVAVDIYFWNGWWWRPWEGRWYRSHYYDRGWAYYNNVPIFYYDVDPRWREYYRAHDWYGHRWDSERIPHRELQHNWKNWHDNRHWERQKAWGVHSYRPRPHEQRQELRRQRQQEYQQRPEVQRHREQMQQERHQPQAQQQRRPHVQQPQHQAQVQHPQQYQHPQQQQPQPSGRQKGKSLHKKKPHGKPERGDEEQRR